MRLRNADITCSKKKLPLMRTFTTTFSTKFITVSLEVPSCRPASEYYHPQPRNVQHHQSRQPLPLRLTSRERLTLGSAAPFLPPLTTTTTTTTITLQPTTVTI
ncbi:hypothetical protein E2C01_017039 [Portunus trituberculatus]|uniref:Uncharacterized protein n=1 Tax=Portunus trituberculatus TaxID=210409 RepID=A0A5B7DR77_PORTR|nr:hypothetical protein [Portunus trituberculatus]